MVIATKTKKVESCILSMLVTFFFLSSRCESRALFLQHLEDDTYLLSTAFCDFDVIKRGSFFASKRMRM